MTQSKSTTAIPAVRSGVPARTAKKRVNLIFDVSDHALLVRYLGWRQTREGVTVSMSRGLMEGLKLSPLFREWEEAIRTQTPGLKRRR